MSEKKKSIELTTSPSTSTGSGDNRRKDKQPVEENEFPVPITAANQGITQINYKTRDFLLHSLGRGENHGNLLDRSPPSIRKVSRILRDLSVRSFIPQLVSIGPIHRENKKLKEFEWLKECYLSDLLNRCEDYMPKEEIIKEKKLEACLQKVIELIPEARKYYGDVRDYSYDEVSKMMVMDGCFILEFCCKLHGGGNWHLPNDMLIDRIAMDLMFLENQVPFVVLQGLFECLAPHNAHMVTRKGPVTDLRQILDAYSAHVNPFHSQLPEEIPTCRNVDHDHILAGYLHSRYQLVAAESSKPKHAEASKLADEEQAAESSNLTDDEVRIEDAAFHSIVELDRSGMNFKPHQKDKWSMTIEFQSPRFSCLPLFWGKPTLLMPTLVIGDSTELILRNFIAYEQSLRHVGYYFTSYAHAMDKLIDSQEDIAKLVESRVLVNNFGSNQEAADMFNKLCKNISITEFYYNQEFKQVDKYYNRFWPKHIAWLRRIYFSNPWTAIALLAAMILFGLTVVQTIFTIKGPINGK